MSDPILGLASLGVAAVATLLWFRAIGRVAIPRNRGGFVLAWLAAAGLAVAALVGEPGWLGGIAAVLGLVASSFFVLTVAIGRQRTGERAVGVGDTLPRFTAADEYGQVFDSASLAGHPVLIKFFRGHW